MQQKKEMKMSGIMLAQFDHSAIPAADACMSSHTHRRLEVAERKNSEFGVAGN